MTAGGVEEGRGEGEAGGWREREEWRTEGIRQTCKDSELNREQIRIDSFVKT